MIQHNLQAPLSAKLALAVVQNVGFFVANLFLANFLFSMVGMLVFSIAILGTFDDIFKTCFQKILMIMLHINPDVDSEHYKTYNQTDLGNLIQKTLLKVNVIAGIILFFLQSLKLIRPIELSLSLKIKVTYLVSFLLSIILLIVYFFGNLAEKSTEEVGFVIVPLLTFLMLSYVTLYPLPFLLAHHFITRVLSHWSSPALEK